MPRGPGEELERLRAQLRRAQEDLEAYARISNGYWWSRTGDDRTPPVGKPVQAWASRGFTRATGHDRDFVAGLAGGAGIHPDDAAGVAATLDALWRGPGAGGRDRAVHEFRLAAADGSLLWVRQRLAAQGLGSARRLWASGELVTERKRTEDALGQVEARFLSLVEHAPNLILTVDREGTILFLNRPVRGDAREPWELIGGSAFELAAPEERDRLRGAIDTVVGRGEAHDFALRGASSADAGEPARIYEVQAAPVMRAGEVVAITMILTDVTDRRAAEDALRRSEARWRFLWENVPDLIAELDADGEVVISNRPLTSAALTEPGSEAGAALRRAMEAAQRTGAAASFELAERDADGHERCYANRVVPLGESGGRGVLLIGTDVSDRKRAERERADLEAQLRQQQKLESIGTLASGVAHEINNPIQSIMNYADLVRMRAEPGGMVDEFAVEIIRETERVANIVRSLLAFARQDKQQHSAAHLSEIVGASLTLMAAVFRRDHIEVEVEVPTGLPAIPCRAQQLQQVFMNLLGNARDALNERYPEYDPNKRIRVYARELERDGEVWVRTTVEDHGVGIPAAVRERIFDPFFTTKGPHAGTGLGLAVSHGIIREHRGELEVDSEPGAGARFHVDLRVDNGWDLELV